MPETSKQLQNRQEQEYKARVGDYLKTFTSAHGRRVLKDMRKRYCGSLYENGMTRESMACQIGKREVVKDIEALLITGKNPKLIEDLFRSPEDDGFEF